MGFHDARRRVDCGYCGGKFDRLDAVIEEDVMEVILKVGLVRLKIIYSAHGGVFVRCARS